MHSHKWSFNSYRHAVIPNGIDSKLLELSATEDDYILFFSRIDSYTKGLDVLLRAFSLIADRFPRISLVLAGHEATKMDDLFALLPDRLRKRVHYMGFVTGEDRLKLLSDAKLIVLPSRHEAHPVSLMEAHACCKPVILSDIPELQYVAHEGIGLAFSSGNADDLAQKIAWAMEDPELRKDLGRRGRRYASNFTWDDLAGQFDSFLSSIVFGQ
ncbi:MAG: glycosyltransferase family 4 protein [Desulfoferrobacter sp.]